MVQIIALAIAVGICLHAGNHLACDFPRLIASGPEEYRLVARFFGRDKPSYRALLAGAEGVTGIVMVTLMAVSFTLATRPFRKREADRANKAAATRGGRRWWPLAHLAGFNAFWYSHHLLIVVYLLLLVHGWFMFLVDKWYQRTVRNYINQSLLLILIHEQQLAGGFISVFNILACCTYTVYIYS
jgi:respiratory burst oxidase